MTAAPMSFSVAARRSLSITAPWKSTAPLSGPGTYTGSVTFGSDPASLVLDQPASFGGQINSLAAGDVIDLANTTLTERGNQRLDTDGDREWWHSAIYQLGNPAAGLGVAVQGDGHNGDELVFNSSELSVAVSVVESCRPARPDAGRAGNAGRRPIPAPRSPISGKLRRTTASPGPTWRRRRPAIHQRCAVVVLSAHRSR